MLLLIAIPAGIVAGVIQSSFFEWTFHRFWLHRPWQPKSCYTSHTLVHHQLCKFEDTFHVVEEEQAEALSFKWWGGPTLIAINLLPWLLAAWALTAFGVPFPYIAFLISLGATNTIYYVAYESLHYLMHRPRIDWLERSRVFRGMKRHHRIHHVRMNRNLNVILPLADLFLGTLVTEMPATAATPQAARRTARRHSEFGKRLPREEE